MTEMSKKTILDGWKRLATDPRLDDCITTLASQCWQFFDELFKKSCSGKFFHDYVDADMAKELRECASFGRICNDCSVSENTHSCVMSEYGIEQFNSWMLHRNPYAKVHKTFLQILQEITTPKKPDDPASPQPPARTCYPLKPVLERQLGILVAASEKAVQNSEIGQLCALSQTIATLTELLLKMQGITSDG